MQKRVIVLTPKILLFGLIVFILATPVFASATVNIIEPVDGGTYEPGTLNLNYTITNTTELTQCWYVIDGVFQNITSNTLPADANTIALYHFEDGSGATVTDSGVNGLDGTAYGGYSWVPGYVGSYAIDLDGSAITNVTLPYTSLWFGNGNGNMTVEFWFKPDNVAGSQWLFDTATPNNHVRVYLSTTTLNFYINNDSSSTGVQFAGVNASQWLYFAGTYNEQEDIQRMYINGVEVGNISRSTGLPAFTNRVVLGEYAEGDNYYFDGSIDELRISDVARTSFGNNPTCDGQNTTFTKNELDTFTVNIHANDTAGAQYNDSVSITTDAVYEIRVNRTDDEYIQENFSVVFYGQGTSVSRTATGQHLIINNSELASVQGQVNISITTDWGAATFQETINNETTTFNETYQIPMRWLNLTFKNEDTGVLLTNVTIWLYNDETSETWPGENQTLEINLSGRFSSSWTVIAQYTKSGITGTREYEITAFDPTQNYNLTVWFPDTFYTYTIYVASSTTNTAVSGALVNLIRSVAGVPTLVGQATTGVTGTVDIIAHPNLPHTINITKAGCSANVFEHTFSSVDFSTINAKLTCTAGGGINTNYISFIMGAEYWCTNTTSELYCYINDSSGVMLSSNLDVRKKTTPIISWTPVCDITNTSSPIATFNCSLGTTTNEFFWLVLTAQIPDQNVLLLSEPLSFGSQVAQYGLYGIFVTFLLFLFFTGVGYWNPVAGLTLGGVSLIISWWLGYLPVSIGAMTSLIAIISIMVVMSKS